MNKILIIGQAPPHVNQRIPYDTTLLYEMLEWINITKDNAQNIFDFDAVYDKFPGWDNGGHRIPTHLEMEHYWNNILKNKVQNSSQILILGNVARDFINSKLGSWSQNKKFVYLIHPSKRNYSRIMDSKKYIITQLQKLDYAS